MCDVSVTPDDMWRHFFSLRYSAQHPEERVRILLSCGLSASHFLSLNFLPLCSAAWNVSHHAGPLKTSVPILEWEIIMFSLHLFIRNILRILALSITLRIFTFLYRGTTILSPFYWKKNQIDSIDNGTLIIVNSGIFFYQANIRNTLKALGSECFV